MSTSSTRKTPLKADLVKQLAEANATITELLDLLTAVSEAANAVPSSAVGVPLSKPLTRAWRILSVIGVVCRQDESFVAEPRYISSYAKQIRRRTAEPINYEIYVPADAKPVAVIPAPPAPATAAGVIEAAKREPCGCPTTAIYHQAGTCSRPVVGHMVIKRDDTDGWISGGMGEQDGDDGRPDGSEFRMEPGCICDANYGECPLHVDVSKPIEGDPVPCKDPQCGHIAADHAITDFSNLAARFPCTRCGCTNFTISSAKVRR